MLVFLSTVVCGALRGGGHNFSNQVQNMSLLVETMKKMRRRSTSAAGCSDGMLCHFFPFAVEEVALF